MKIIKTQCVCGNPITLTLRRNRVEKFICAECNQILVYKWTKRFWWWPGKVENGTYGFVGGHKGAAQGGLK